MTLYCYFAVQECREPLVWSVNNSVASLDGLEPISPDNLFEAGLYDSPGYQCTVNDPSCWYEVSQTYNLRGSFLYLCFILGYLSVCVCVCLCLCVCVCVR